MPADSPHPSSGSPPGPGVDDSRRIALANLAVLAVARTPGVSLSDRDPRRVTVDRDRALRGVTSEPTGDGRFDLDLYTVIAARAESLPALIAELRGRVISAVRRAAIDPYLRSLCVHVDAVHRCRPSVADA